MTLDHFHQSLQQPAPPSALPPLLAALWWDAKSDWERAHELAQGEESVDAAWIHAYLHRKEGDAANAAYWYSRAGRPHCRLSLDAEWHQIVSALITRTSN
jgi:hypothetical protein